MRIVSTGRYANALAQRAACRMHLFDFAGAAGDYEALRADAARQDSAEDFCRLKAPRCAAMDRILIPASCFAIP